MDSYSWVQQETDLQLSERALTFNFTLKNSPFNFTLKNSPFNLTLNNLPFNLPQNMYTILRPIEFRCTERNRRLCLNKIRVPQDLLARNADKIDISFSGVYAFWRQLKRLIILLSVHKIGNSVSLRVGNVKLIKPSYK